MKKIPTTFTISLLMALPLMAEKFDEPERLSSELHGDKTMAASIADFDGDGKNDIIVAGYAGDFKWAKNVGSKASPKYEKAKKLFSLTHW